MLRRLYDWTMRMAAHRHADWALAAVSFLESSFFPIPPDVIMIPMVLAQRARTWWITLNCTVASVIGGLFGYAIGFFLFDALGGPLLDFYGLNEKFAEFQDSYNEWGAWIVFIAGVTPFPYKVITIASGVTKLDIVTFTGASILARGLRFFIVAGLLWWIGPPIREFIERRLGLVFTVFVVLLVGGFAALKLLS
jgi:membrane protein YqaA with SNARE-associated domain